MLSRSLCAVAKLSKSLYGYGTPTPASNPPPSPQVKREKSLLAGCDCPWLVSLEATTNDDSCVYMLLEAVMGGELFTYLAVRRADTAYGLEL